MVKECEVNMLMQLVDWLEGTKPTLSLAMTSKAYDGASHRLRVTKTPTQYGALQVCERQRQTTVDVEAAEARYPKHLQRNVQL